VSVSEDCRASKTMAASLISRKPQVVGRGAPRCASKGRVAREEGGKEGRRQETCIYELSPRLTCDCGRAGSGLRRWRSCRSIRPRRRLGRRSWSGDGRQARLLPRRMLPGMRCGKETVQPSKDLAPKGGTSRKRSSRGGLLSLCLLPCAASRCFNNPGKHAHHTLA
jgi:hypothetical protein